MRSTKEETINIGLRVTTSYLNCKLTPISMHTDFKVKINDFVKKSKQYGTDSKETNFMNTKQMSDRKTHY